MNNTTQTLLEASNASLVRNFEPTRCLQCDKFLQINTGVILRDCFHIFCDRCLVRTIKTTMLYSVRVHCPAEINGDPGCTTLLQEREIRALLSGEDYRKYEQKCLELAEADVASSVHCFAPRCKGWIEVTGFMASFECPVCSNKNCLQCKTIHPELNCEEFQVKKNNMANEPSGSKLTIPNLKTTIDLEQLRTASDAVLARNLYSSKCPICDEDVPVNEGVILRDCFHIICEECIVNTIKANLNENVEVRCPALLDDGQRCSTIVQEREIKILLESEEYEKFEQRCLDVAEAGFESSVHCLTPNCKGWVVLEGNNRLQSFQCPICSSENCLTCKAIHPEKSCDDYKADLKRNCDEELSESAIKKLLDAHEAVLCPKCKRVILKDGGCDHMTCIKCKHEFYWTTGDPYPKSPLGIFLLSRMRS